MSNKNKIPIVQKLLCQLMVSEERYQNFMNATTDSIFINTLDGFFLDANNAACNSLGYTRKEITNMSVWDIEVGFSKETINELSLKLTESPFNVEGCHRRKNGSTFPVDVRLGAFKSMGKTMILAIVRDISEEKKAASTIKKLTFALDQISSLVIVTDKKGIIEYANSKVMEQTGYSSDDIIGQSLGMLQSGNTSNEVYQTIWEQLINNKTWHGNMLHRNKNGEHYRVSVKLSPILDKKDNEITHYLTIMDICSRE